MTDAIATLRTSQQRLRSVVEPLTPEQVRQGAYPAEWSIAQVLSHLGSGAEIGALSVEAAIAGSEPPARESFPTIWDRWNAKTPDEMVADGIASDARLVALVESLRAPAYEDLKIRTFLGDVDRMTYARMRLAEHAVHTWDVAVAVQPGATVSADAVELVLANTAGLIGFVAKPNGRTGLVHVITSDPENEYALTLGESTTLTAWAGAEVGAEATATLRIPAEAFLRLTCGRLDPANTPDGVRAEGMELDDLRAVFPGF